jgi:hypothetical protein
VPAQVTRAGKAWVATGYTGNDTLKMYEVERLIRNFSAQVWSSAPKAESSRGPRRLLSKANIGAFDP